MPCPNPESCFSSIRSRLCFNSLFLPTQKSSCSAFKRLAQFAGRSH